MDRRRGLGAALAIAVVAIVAIVVVPRIAGRETADELPTSGPFTGVVTDVESTGLNEVTSFEVRHDGMTTTVYVREDFDYGFPIGHLQEHLASGDPVTVEGETIDGKLYADSIEDA